MNRINSLDGLRAISIIMVLLAHAGPTMPLVMTNNIFYETFSNSYLGVKFFFVISGYLITKLLILENDKNATVNIKQFYARRGLRIFPIFYIYVMVIIIIKSTFIVDIIHSYHDVIPVIFYLWNYKHLWTSTIGNGNWFLGHFWSLCMEEQFYLLWPFIFLTFYVKPAKDRLMAIVIGAIILVPILRIATYIWMPNSRGQIGMMLQTGGDTILVGCYGALIENKSSFRNRYVKYLQNKFLILFSVVFVFVVSPFLGNHFRGAYTLPIGSSLENLFILVIILFSIHVPSLYRDMLNNKFLVKIGILSYSLYVWQQLFLNNIYNYWINKFPQNLFIVFLVGFISYYLIEKPILRYKSRFKTVSGDGIIKEKVVTISSM